MKKKSSRQITAFILALALILTMLPLGTVSAAQGDMDRREDYIGRLGMQVLEAFDDSAAWGEIKDKALLAAESIKTNEAAKGESLLAVGTYLTEVMKNDPDAGHRSCYASAAALLISAIEENEAQKSEGISLMAEELFSAVYQAPDRWAYFIDAADTMISVIAAGDAAKSRGLGAVGSFFLHYLRSYSEKEAVVSEAALGVIEEIQNAPAAKSYWLGIAASFLLKAAVSPDNTPEQILTRDAKASAAALIFDAIRSDDAAKGLGLDYFGNALFNLLSNDSVTKEAILDAGEYIVDAIKNSETAKSCGISVLGAGLMASIRRQPMLYGDLITAAGIVLDAITVNGSGKSEALGLMGWAILEGISRQPEAYGKIVSAAGIMIDAVSGNEAAKSEGLGSMGASVMDAVARQPEAYDKIISAAGIMAEAIESNEAYKSGRYVNSIEEMMINNYDANRIYGFGGMGSAAVDALARQPEEYGKIISAAGIMIDAIAGNEAAKSDGLGHMGASMMDAVARQPEAYDRIVSAAGIMMDAIAGNEAAKSDGLGHMGANMMDAIARQPEAYGRIVSAAGIIIDAIAENEAGKSEGLGHMGANMMDAIARQPEAYGKIISAAGIMADAIAGNEAGKSEGLGHMGANMMDAIARQPEAYGKIVSAAGIMADAISTNAAVKSTGIGFTGSELMIAVGRYPERYNMLVSAAMEFIDVIAAVPPDPVIPADSGDDGGPWGPVTQNLSSALSAEGGKISLSTETARTGDSVTLAVTPEEGKRFASLRVETSDGKPVRLTDMGNGVYSFVMPQSRIKIKAVFKAASDTDNPYADRPAEFSPQHILFNGVEQKMEVYSIGARNYFKIRDLAALLKGTSSQFNVDFDEERRTVVVECGKAYGGSLPGSFEDMSATAAKSVHTFEIDGSIVSLTAYEIGGYNFFGLRELAEYIGYGVDYDAASDTALINTK